jgi:pimeloyl-ACP methyl ester carboxylesterase
MFKLFKWATGILFLLIVAGIAIGYTPDTDAAAMKAKYSSATSRFAEVSPGLTVHYRDEGRKDGRALFLVHGSNASLHTWEPWVQRLGSDYRIISLDLPGHGLTGAHPDRRYDTRTYAETVDLLATKLGLRRFVIGGNSMGGGVSWSYALAHPEKVDALLLVDASGAPQSLARDLPIGFRLAGMPVIKHLAKIVMPRAVIEASVKKSMSVQTGINNALVDRYWELNRYPGNRDATMRRFSARDQIVSADPLQLANIKVPVMIIWGAQDRLIPQSSANWFAKAMPAAKLIIYPGVGHIPMEEVPNRSAADVKAWLNGFTDRSVPKPLSLN